MSPSELQMQQNTDIVVSGPVVCNGGSLMMAVVLLFAVPAVTSPTRGLPVMLIVLSVFIETSSVQEEAKWLNVQYP